MKDHLLMPQERDNSLSTEYITQINYYMGISHKHMVVSDVQSKSIQKTCILKRLMWFEGWLVCCRLTSIYTQLIYILEMAGVAVPCFLCDFLLFLLEPIFLISCAL